MKKVTAIFDIGKTNKKFFLFDKNLHIVFRISEVFETAIDEDGFPCDSLALIQKWVICTYNKVIESGEYLVEALNFTSYGASFVHIDKEGKALTPLYDYSKPIDQRYIDELYSKYGGCNKISRETGSPPSGMLNSGIQLYWLKYYKPDIYRKIKYSLHLPQYLSYLFTGKFYSDLTSIGCHTMLYSYDEMGYHKWVKSEGIEQKLAPIRGHDEYIEELINGVKVRVGIGIHDSSAALIPYLNKYNDFLLVSTGTWIIVLNPFCHEGLKGSDIELGCLNYIQYQGKAVRATRAFIGYEFQEYVLKLNKFFGKEDSYHTSVEYSLDYVIAIENLDKNYFDFSSSSNTMRFENESIELDELFSFEYAYHQLLMEVCLVLIKNIHLAQGNSFVKTIIVEGGFVANDVFVNMLAYKFPEMDLVISNSSQGSALGAAMLIQ